MSDVNFKEVNMKPSKLSAPKISKQLSAWLLLLFITVAISAQANESSDLNKKSNQNNDTQATSNESTSGLVPPNQTNGRPASDKKLSGRQGRMLNLDRLTGDLRPDNSASTGARQSRKLDEKVNDGVEERSRKSSKNVKKLAIKGFIPILGVEAGKDGKQLESLAEHLTSDSDQEQDSSGESEPEQQPQNNQYLREQIASNFGAQTSLGHASFAVPQQQQQQQYAPNDGNHHHQWQTDEQESARARKLQLTGSLLGSGQRHGHLRPLSTGLVSSFVQHPLLLEQQQQQQQMQMQLTGPMNTPPAHLHQPQVAAQQASFGSGFEPLSGEQCICVPFFQCKGGFLTEAQLSKSQLAQVGAMGQQSMQSPRALNGQDHVALGAQRGLATQPHDQQMVNDIYEQLRKNIESQNLERELLLQQQAQRGLIDERSAKSNASSPTTVEVEQRSLIETLGANLNHRRQSGSPRQCGIMRTCCRVPPHLTAGAQRQQPQAARFVQRQQPRYQMITPLMAHQTQQVPAQMQPFLDKDSQNDLSMALGAQPNQPAYGQQHQSSLGGNYDQSMALASHQRPSAGQSQFQAQPQPQPLAPSGQFMAGRCGLRQTLGISGRVQNAPAQAQGEQSTSEFGEFPAHAAILRRISPGDSLFVCSAVLISSQWLATAAHCLKRLRADELKVRLGEWDVSRDDEFYPHVEANVRELLIHPDFQASSLINDVALVRLDQSVGGPAGEQMAHISPACLAQPGEQFAGQRCWLAGWGKDAFGQSGAFQSTLHKVDLPVVSHQDCESALRSQTKLGRYFRLHQNNVCAGGERGKDACEGDGGAGLYCLDPASGLSKAVGLVSWGVGCGQRGVPGVYASLASFSPWIEQVVSASGEENLSSYSDLLNGRQQQQQQQAVEAFRAVISERSNEKNANETAAALAETNNSSSSDPMPATQLEWSAGLEQRSGPNNSTTQLKPNEQ